MSVREEDRVIVSHKEEPQLGWLLVAGSSLFNNNLYAFGFCLLEYYSFILILFIISLIRKNRIN